MQELMKKIVYAIAALALIFTGCAKELDNSTKDNFSTVRLHVKVADQLTKVSADNDGRYHWQGGDKITVFDNKQASFEFSTENGGSDVDFGATSWSGEDLGKYAMYPASSHSVSGNVVGFNLPSSYKWKANSTNMPMLGKINEDVATFKAVGGVLKLVCYNVPADAVKMEFSATNKKISGSFNIDNAAVENPIIVTAAMAESNNKVSFDFTGDRKDNMVFYIPLPTGTIDGFTVSFLSDVPEVVFTKTSTKTLSVSRNQMIIAPALNCSVPKNDVLTNDDITGSSLTGSYSDVNITSATGKTWKVNACKQVGYLQMKNTSHIQLPSYDSNIASIILHDTHNGSGGAYSSTLTLSTAKSAGTTITTLTPDVESGDDITIDVPNGYSTGYILTSGGLRVNSITVTFRGSSPSAPTIKPASDALVIAVGAGDTNSALTTFTLENRVDELGVTAESDKDWVTPSITGSYPDYTLTVTASKKIDAGAREQAKVTLRATGVTKIITVDQPSAMVDNPSSITVVNQNESFYATWAPVDNALSYKAYLCASSGLADPTSGTELTPIVEGGVYKVSADGLTNGANYYLYVKTHTVSSNYVVPTDYVEETVTPAIPAKGTIGNPYTIAEAISHCKTLGKNGTQADVAVYGIVSNVQTVNTTDGWVTYWLSDDGTYANDKNVDYQVYRGKGLLGADIVSESDIMVGDIVTVIGTMKYYNGSTCEFDAGSEIRSQVHKVATPTFNVAEGTYYSAQSITISCATESSTIHYTTDGSVPTSASTTYSSPIDISTTTTIKAIAVRDGFEDSEVASATYTIESPTQLVMSTITCTGKTDNSLVFEWTAVEHATGYRVSLDGGTNWEEKQDDLNYAWIGLDASTTYTIKVKAIGTANGQYTDSEPGTQSGTTTAAAAISAPSFNRASGSTVASNLTVIITSISGSTIYYTTNGDNPEVGGATTTAGTEGAGSVEIPVAKTIKAIAVKGGDVSSVGTATYTLRHTDTITASMLKATSTTYVDFSDVSATDASHSAAVYAGNNGKDSSGNIQLRSKNSNSGIVSTVSGGKLVSVTINVGSGSNTVDIYGKTSAYTGASQLYNASTQGTKIGSTSSTATINVDGDYQYVGIRSNSGALYLSSVVIVWDE